MRQEATTEHLNVTHLTKPDGVSDETMLDAFHAFFDSSPETAALSHRLLTTGTRTGQRLVREHLSDSVARIADRFRSTGTRKLSYNLKDDGYLIGVLIRSWSYGNIREEAGISPESISEEDLKDLAYAKAYATMHENSYDDIPEEEYRSMSPAVEKYWRGASVLALCFDAEESDDEQWEQIDPFIQWVANHQDIGKVIRTARKWNSLKIEDLEHYMDAADAGVPMNLTNGWI